MNWDITKLTVCPEYETINRDGCIELIRFENEPFHGKSTKIYAYLSIPQNVVAKVPGVVLVHGAASRRNV